MPASPSSLDPELRFPGPARCSVGALHECVITTCKGRGCEPALGDAHQPSSRPAVHCAAHAGNALEGILAAHTVLYSCLQRDREPSCSWRCCQHCSFWTPVLLSMAIVGRVLQQGRPPLSRAVHCADAWGCTPAGAAGWQEAPAPCS
jgi:hypothetical protein